MKFDVKTSIKMHTHSLPSFSKVELDKTDDNDEAKTTKKSKTNYLNTCIKRLKHNFFENDIASYNYQINYT